MSAYQRCFSSFGIVCCLLAGCGTQKQASETDGVPGGSAGTPSDMMGGGGSAAGGKSGARITSAGDAGNANAGDAGDAAGGHDNNPVAGAGGADAGAAGAAPEAPPAVCELDGGSCVSSRNSACSRPSATCTVVDLGFSCEFSEFKDTSAVVACGATATAGLACCGGCGCVNVELYYDGKYCWQGIPDCQMDGYSGKLFDPRLP